MIYTAKNRQTVNKVCMYQAFQSAYHPEDHLRPTHLFTQVCFRTNLCEYMRIIEYSVDLYRNSNGNKFKIQALLDGGSSTGLVRDDLVRKLRLKTS